MCWRIYEESLAVAKAHFEVHVKKLRNFLNLLQNHWVLQNTFVPEKQTDFVAKCQIIPRRYLFQWRGSFLFSNVTTYIK